MSVMTRRSSTRKSEKEELKQDIEDDVEEILDDDDDEDDDAPPPVLEREESCGENEDTDGDAKEGEDTTPPLQKESPREEEDVEEDSTKGFNLMEALAGVFSTDEKKKNKNNSDYKALADLPIAALKPVVLGRGPGRPLGSTNANSLRFGNLRNPVASTSSASTSGASKLDGRRNYGNPPPFPQALRPLVTSGVGSNTTPGPVRLLENRKRTLNEKELIVPKRPSLVAYNGGRAGEKFRGSGNASTSTSAIDMLRDQSPVRIQVSAGGIDDSDNHVDNMELASQQKERIGQVAKAASNHTLLLGSMVINGLSSLQERNNSDDYNKFSSELFALITKYRIQ